MNNRLSQSAITLARRLARPSIAAVVCGMGLYAMAFAGLMLGTERQQPISIIEPDMPIRVRDPNNFFRITTVPSTDPSVDYFLDVSVGKVFEVANGRVPIVESTPSRGSIALRPDWAMSGYLHQIAADLTWKPLGFVYGIAACIGLSHGLLLLATGLRRAILRETRARKAACRSCGYANSAAQRCPECGEAPHRSAGRDSTAPRS
jgi:hypothetical protein